MSLLGIGGGYVMLRHIEQGTRLYRRAADLGVNYFDGRYGRSSSMQRLVIANDREHFIIGSKTASTTRSDMVRRIDNDLDVAALDRPVMALSPEEEAEVARLTAA